MSVKVVPADGLNRCYRRREKSSRPCRQGAYGQGIQKEQGGGKAKGIY